MSGLALESPTASWIDATVSRILDAQSEGGAIPWYRGGKTDPWNHVEAVMALALTGESDAARRGFEWLANRQRRDGSWFASYRDDTSELDDHCDTNATAYIATGIHLYLLATGDLRFARELFGPVDRALDFVVGHVDAQGMLPWSVGPGARRSRDALLAASASVVLSLRCGVRLAGRLGYERHSWLGAAERIARRIRQFESAFLDKSVFAMDWYYPVLAGVLDSHAARLRLQQRATGFIVPGCGVRCRSDGNWVTAAESAECAIAYARAGLAASARSIAALAFSLRDETGAFPTGVVSPHRDEFPRGERTTYSAGAALIAADVLAGGASTGVFSPLSGTAAPRGLAGSRSDC